MRVTHSSSYSAAILLTTAASTRASLTSYSTNIGFANEALLSSLTIKLEEIECSSLLLTLHMAVQRTFSVAKRRPALSLKVKANVHYGCRALQAPKEITLELEMNSLQASCDASIADVEARVSAEASLSARADLKGVGAALRCVIAGNCA